MTTYTAGVSRAANGDPIRITGGKYLNGARENRAEAYLRTARTAIVASSDKLLGQRLASALEDLRWVVRLAAGGAEAMAHLDADLDTQTGESEAVRPSTLLVDSWLPDLEVRELVRELGELYPDLDVLAIDGTELGAPAARGAYRHEVLLALRAAHAGDEAAWTLAPTEQSILNEVGRHMIPWQHPAGGADNAVATSQESLAWTEDRLTASAVAASVVRPKDERSWDERSRDERSRDERSGDERSREQAPRERHPSPGSRSSATEIGGALRGDEAVTPAVAPPRLEVAPPRVAVAPLPELIGSSAAMLEVSRRIRLVAPRTTSVLIEGATGTGKELVARALHRLSPRSTRSFVALNCAAIPEALLESELFGHTRGAFTGASQARVGRIEAAHGGTLFLDEIGELPLALQAKLLRFLECGELQRVGENEPVRVDVRVVAATHRGLASMARDGRFRADLFYRLSVFLIRTPSLTEHAADLPALVEHFLARMGRTEPAKRLSPEALGTLTAHSWPGNVRELEHVLERAWILSEDRPVMVADEIEFGEPML